MCLGVHIRRKQWDGAQVSSGAGGVCSALFGVDIWRLGLFCQVGECYLSMAATHQCRLSIGFFSFVLSNVFDSR